MVDQEKNFDQGKVIFKKATKQNSWACLGQKPFEISDCLSAMALHRFVDHIF